MKAHSVMAVSKTLARTDVALLVQLVDLKATRKVVAVFVEMLGMLMIALEIASKSML